MEINGSPARLPDVAALALAGYGHFTSMRVDEGRVRGLELHLRRLVRDCRTVFGAELESETVLGYVRHAVAGRSGSFVVRVTVFDPGLDITRPEADAHPCVAVTTRAAGPLSSPPLRVRSVTYSRDTPEVKHVGLFGQLARRRDARAAGYDDALYTEPDGRVSEGPTWNVGFVIGDRLVWPDAPCLHGVTVDLLDAVEPSTRTAVRIDELADVQAAFVTNAGIGVRSIASIDGVRLRTDHPLTRRLGAAYLSLPGDPL